MKMLSTELSQITTRRSNLLKMLRDNPDMDSTKTRDRIKEYNRQINKIRKELRRDVR